MLDGMNRERKAQNIFLNLEKRNHVKKHIRKLCINGKITTDPHCILREQERFYRELYKSSINSPNIGEKSSSFLNDLNIPQLSEEHKNSCEGLISPEECSKLLHSLQSNKSPGNDGIPAEFYRKFWPLISKIRNKEFFERKWIMHDAFLKLTVLTPYYLIALLYYFLTSFSPVII